MSDQVFNLDEGVEEYTEFTLLGKKYQFRQFNTDEAAELMRLSEDKKYDEINAMYEKFIIPVGDSPAYSEIKGKMLMGHHKNLKNMMYAIMGIDENNKGTESTPAVPTE